MRHTPLIVGPSEYPKPLDVVGEKITVLAAGAATGSYEVFIRSGDVGSGPEPHDHPWDESFYILHGEVEFNVDSIATRIATPGTLVHVPAGCTRWFRWREGAARCCRSPLAKQPPGCSPTYRRPRPISGRAARS